MTIESGDTAQDGSAASAAVTERSAETREAILTAAERLFAERGMSPVSNRQIGAAAGQANNSAVGYHFGSRTELVVAILRRHAAPIERRRAAMLAGLDTTSQLHDWIRCLVQPLTDHLADLGHPSWYARFLAQADIEPALRRVMVDNAAASPTMGQVVDGLCQLLPALPEHVHAERGAMSRQLIVHTCAERERALHEGGPTAHPTWQATATGLVDAIVGLWLTPVTPA